MREIKFRGLNTKGEWVYGSLVTTTHGLNHKQAQKTKTWIVESAFANGGWFNVIKRQYVRPETVGQFADQIDENGVEICEGDIVLIEGDVSLVRFHGGALCVDVYGMDYDFTAVGWVEQAIEVIGNIHQNPELLESL